MISKCDAYIETHMELGNTESYDIIDDMIYLNFKTGAVFNDKEL